MFKLRKIIFSSMMIISMVLFSSCFSSYNYSLKFANGTFQSSEESIQEAIEKEYLLKNITISLEEIEPISECAEKKTDWSPFPDECLNVFKNFNDNKQYKCEFILSIGKEYTCDITQLNQYANYGHPANLYFYIIDVTDAFLDLNLDTDKTRVTMNLNLRFESISKYSDNYNGKKELEGAYCYFSGYTFYPLTGEEEWGDWNKYTLPIPRNYSHYLDFYPNNN